MRCGWTILLLATGCGGAAAVEEMRQGLVRVDEALAVSLLLAETPSYGVDPLATSDHDFRHPDGGPCPSNERDVADPVAWALSELDYGAGCVPRSGLVPALISGRTTLGHDAGEVQVALEGLQVALHNTLDGDFSGRIDGDAEARSLEGAGWLRVEGTDQALEADVALAARLTPLAVELDGEVALDQSTVTLSEVHLPLSEIGGECPTPTSGTARVQGEGRPIEVTFGGDEVIVARGQRTSDPTSLCGYASWLLKGGSGRSR